MSLDIRLRGCSAEAIDVLGDKGEVFELAFGGAGVACAGGVVTLTTRVTRPFDDASTIRTVPSEKLIVSCCMPLTTTCETSRFFKPCVSDPESRGRVCMMIPGWRFVGFGPGMARRYRPISG